MSITCCLPIVESVYCLACARWLWKKCLYSAGHESENWGLATAEEFAPVPRLCRYVLAEYEDDLRNPIWAPPGGYGINPDWVVHRKDYDETLGRAPPYMLYMDHERRDIVLIIRGLNLAKESDYAVLLDNKLGQTKLDGGYVHNGLLKSAMWVFDAECEVLKELLESFPEYTLTFAGHSLGAGVDDFLPRTTTALEDVFKSVLCLPCLLCLMCLKDTCILEDQMLRDPRRLYAPGRLYHIVERKPMRLGRFPPVVRTAVPVDGRFEHIVISCNAMSDHAVIWIERESQRALDVMLERDKSMDIPVSQRMERQVSVVREHDEEYKAALQRAVDLDIPLAYPPTYGTFDEVEAESSERSREEPPLLSSSERKESWDGFVRRLFHVNDSGQMVFKIS
ncbi:hypothetical protein EUGRSUZ_E00140 [Eucalyptus grandis]|uniref:Fungal lipase-like domain-containing protein n=2 Tax=Eucalyptus grandis TaxID=71139 RepID=A0A059C067_EUCGR|nr:hypothetical protein EUGRSUZ_E00140 [Eucalyptus grandis]